MLKILIFNALLVFHPIHVTLTSINQAPDNDTLEVFFRMYHDDFLLDYKSYDQDFFIEKESENIIIPDDLINKYFNDKVQIYINNKLLIGKLLTVSNDNYEICLTLIYNSEKKPRKFKIRNQVLINLYSDQANMVYLNINKYEDAMKLTSKHYEEARNLR